MKPRDGADEYDLRLYRKSIETVNGQLESIGLERLKARTNGGFNLLGMVVNIKRMVKRLLGGLATATAPAAVHLPGAAA